MKKIAPLPIVRWPGGKRRHLKLLLPLIKPHVCYMEVFAGGLAVLLAKERSQVEIVNDTNRDLVALYRCAQFHLEALIQETEWQLACRVNFKDFPENRGLTDLQRATRFFVSNLTSFAGDGKSFGVAKTNGGGVALNRQRIIDRLTELRQRMDRVVVECLDWKRCVALYDSPDTFFFFDPPYLNAKISAYAGWTEEQMGELRDVLRTIKGKWMVTVDGSEFCKKLFSEWNVRVIETQNRAVNNRLVAGARSPERHAFLDYAGQLQGPCVYIPDRKEAKQLPLEGRWFGPVDRAGFQAIQASAPLLIQRSSILCHDRRSFHRAGHLNRIAEGFQAFCNGDEK